MKLHIVLIVLIVLFCFRKGRIARYTSPTGKTWDIFTDALSQPHLLIAGATGSGKSVLINGLISNLMYRLPFDQQDGAQIILIDPKRVELAAYSNLPHTLTHAAGFNPDAWNRALSQAVSVMDNRFTYMKRHRLKEYNKGDLYVIIDEWANVYKNGGKDAYKAVLRLTSEGRAAHVHVILATQIPKSTIIPTEIRENFSARFCLFTNNAMQSRVIMGTNGCEDLPDPKTVGYAQGYYVLPGKCNNTLYNIPYVRQDELDSLVHWWDVQNRKNLILRHAC